MFKGKARVKTELEVFSEQRYKDTAVIIYRQLKGKCAVDSQTPIKDVRKGWVDSEATITQRSSDDSTIKDRTVDEASRSEQLQNPNNSVQSKVCSIL